MTHFRDAYSKTLIPYDYGALPFKTGMGDFAVSHHDMECLSVLGYGLGFGEAV